MSKNKLDVYSPMKGKVKYALKAGSSEYGNRVYIEYDNCILMFAHLESFTVTQGQEVEPYEIIGLMGDSGFAPSIHLHVSAFSKRTKQLNARNTIDPTFILQLAIAPCCNMQVSNPFHSKYCNPILGIHEGLDFSGIHLVIGWKTKVDPLDLDYLLIEDHPEYYGEEK